MFSALSKAFAQCTDPAFRGVLVRALLASIVLFVVVWIAAWFGLAWLGEGLAEWVASWGAGETVTGLVEWLFGAVVLGGILFASFLLFPAVTVLLLSVFLEDIAAAVEAKHYPDLPPSRRQPVTDGIRVALSFAATTILLNLVFLPLYLLLTFLPPFNFFVFYALNGYLLGREYFELVAQRRLDPAAMKQLRKARRGRVFMAGIVIAVLLTVPLVNVVMPIVATGFMVHVFEGLRRGAKA